ncbi:divalent-cation tolerance protein CutA [Chelativorans intermedius]|uniref:Divalent-cation tolerance protein CutA n=1 Tax=Chelativorans intermedius TaxID=515947 RepID=A0ABV6D8J2_9HYPH|nr:divalent-cation tolerance protein CutA [Chelativorans intermedius]MCT8998164.1 divalent-cation tolerance protein CutA [Chelativorans intermedius]
MAHFIDIWINCPDRQTAKKIAAACIEARLAACANILAPVSSLYRWQGKVESAEEVPLLLKTRAAHFDAVCETVRPLHPYDTPSIVATALDDIDQRYADWLRKETKEPA